YSQEELGLRLRALEARGLDLKDFIIQEMLEGEEITIDAIFDKNSELIVCVPRYRISTRGGISTKGQTIVDSKIDSLVERIGKSVGATYASCIQAIRDTKDGIYKVTEINPRFSGGLMLSNEAIYQENGFDLARVISDVLKDEEVGKVMHKTGLNFTRHFDEIYFLESVKHNIYRKKLTVVALGAHPDDIEFGCGATLASLANAGNDVYYAILSYGEGGGNPEARMKEAKSAAEIIGAKDIVFLGYKDREMPLSGRLIDDTEKLIEKWRPDIVFANSEHHHHQDHQTAAKLAKIAGRDKIPTLLFYELPPYNPMGGFLPALFVEVSEEDFEKKLEALSCFESQIGKSYFNPDVIRTCAKFRRIQMIEGFSNLCESFEIGKFAITEEMGIITPKKLRKKLK
ncbi:ATP-grasp domain-containing protein, partial [Candidatus Woesearchaeota archaeon]|nr:ATP-grasp domain-containing protein [Candidatus Woesearchaeota archaeon]